MDQEQPQRVTVVDVNMPFLSMVGFMVKWAIASIPAMLIVGGIVGGILALIGTLLAGMLAGAAGMARPT